MAAGGCKGGGLSCGDPGGSHPPFTQTQSGPGLTVVQSCAVETTFRPELRAKQKSAAIVSRS
jgi:hypothetical protein